MSQAPEADDLEPEYDSSGALRGKYYQRYHRCIKGHRARRRGLN